MDACDVLIVGAGPAGTSCAWKLRNAGLAVVILDKQTFPRDKVCGGWITPPVVDELELDLQGYARGRVLQPICGFRTSRIGGREVQTSYNCPVSYAIRRCEFDDFLLNRCGASIRQATPLTGIERAGGRWVVNGSFKARLVIGAGGHFCPVARLRGANARKEIPVTAQEMEFEMTPDQIRDCSIQGETPELYFCTDMMGYGWCVRKNNYLNVGLGRLDLHALPSYICSFLDFLKKTGKVAFDLPGKMRGHSYLLYGHAERNVAEDGILLIGDAAGLAYGQSGEGIRPAVESGLLAAKAVLSAGLHSPARVCETYRGLLAQRFGKSQRESISSLGRRLPAGLRSFLSQFLLTNRWFSRHVLLERWFLHRHEPALSC